MRNLGEQEKANHGITLIALVITIIVLLILAGVSIATLTGENGVLNKASKAKEEHLIEQYKEEINLIIIDEIAERKTQSKEELMIVSLDTKIRKKEWVNEIYKCNSSGEEQPTFEASTHLLVESKEHYEFLIEVNEAKQTAKIVSFGKGTGEKYTIRYHPNGGEGQEETVEIRQGFSVTLKECDYTREQYKFVGWCENQNGEGERYLGNASYKPEGQVTLYAIWELNVATITFDSNDGSDNTKQVTVTKGKETKLPANSFIRNGYTFLEWNTKADGSGEKYEEGANISIGQDVTLYAIWWAPSTIEEAKEAGIVLNQDNPITLTDTYGNEVKVPEGFKIAEDSANDVTGGVVIEDVSHGATAGSQFVWIPVGTIYTSLNNATSKTIALDRYTFDDNGNPTAKGENIADTYYEELTTSTKGSVVAKDINGFKTSVATNGGYYMGRYEARSVTERKAKTDNLGQLTIQANDYIYNYVTEPQAANLSRNMYGTNKKFTSDLVNSYAWDTAIIFLQTFDNRQNKTKPYARQTGLTSSFVPKGTNNLTETERQDKICNIWDMASNDMEWSTETSSGLYYPGVFRGGKNDADNDQYTCRRWGNDDVGMSYDWITFRPILYL